MTALFSNGDFFIEGSFR